MTIGFGGLRNLWFHPDIILLCFIEDILLRYVYKSQEKNDKNISHTSEIVEYISCHIFSGSFPILLKLYLI